MKKKIFIATLLILSSLIIIINGIIFFYPTPYIDMPYYLEVRNEKQEYNYSLMRGYQGKYVTLDEVSHFFIKIVIAIEDQHFYEHNGFDYLRIIQSTFDNIASSSLNQGASTITQQLARTIYLNNNKTWSRKIEEAIITKKIESKYTKDKILELYINSVYFAHNLYGIQAASKYYFNKDPKDLNYSESCMLVGIINGPNLYSPFIDYDAAINKQHSIAYQLFHQKIITVQEYYEILRTPIKLHGQQNQIDILTPYYHQGITQQLKSLNLTNDEIKSQGLIIDSYLDLNIQNNIQKIISNYQFDEEIAVIVMKPYSGKILALTGGKNYYNSQYNRALDSKRQIGSTIKPLIYYQCLKSGMSPLSQFTSEETNFQLEDGTVYTPKNANNIYANRKINMIEALGMSDNIYAVKSTLFIGSESISTLLKEFNVETKNVNLTLSLGTVEMSPLELISIYNTFASEGIYYQPSFISKITRADNITLFEDGWSRKRIFSIEDCLITNYMMKAPFDKALITYSTPTMKNYNLDKTFACKTGTTYSSSWTVGFNPNYTILVYLGFDNNEPLKNSNISKKIFRDIANTLTRNDDDIFYSYPVSLKSFKFYNPIYSTYSTDYLRKRN